ncbi:MAG TPA: plasma-membrane proton-efflux P-type ATPase [Casimicrobiaceae bacterium]|nr:plasma-membrane proton-efflux P-type ATPase [Casimicrobiaceae bacterium]
MTQPATTTLLELSSSLERGLPSATATARLAADGANDVPEEKSHPLLRLARKFWGLSAWMIELIALLSFILHKEADLAVALALLVVNAILSFLEEQKASAAVAALRRKLDVTARVLRDGAWNALPARMLVRGDVVRIRAGDFVPADVQVIDGTLQVDQSALTGESREAAKAADDSVYSGSIARRGEGNAVVTATGVRTYFGRTTQLVQSARPKLHVEDVVSRLVRWLLAVVGSLVAVTLVVSQVRGLPLTETIPIALVVLMSAIPVALPVMFSVSMALGSMELARNGVLIARLSAIEDAATMDVLCADKTGTLTMNRLSFEGTLPQPGFGEGEVIGTGALASNEANEDPIDIAFLRAAKDRGLVDASVRVVSFEPFSAATRRTEALVETGGRKVRAVKGALRTVAALAGLDPAAISALEEQASARIATGARVLAVARSEGDSPLQLVGLAYLQDPPRPDSARLIGELRALGIGVKMLTGDALPVAREIARRLGLGTIVRAPELRAATPGADARAADLASRADGFAEVLPEDKFEVVKRLQAAGHVVGMTGDGVNDAPALRQAEVGIAVSGATDVAKAAASAVLTTEGLVDIVDLVKSGRAIYQRVLTWIVNKVSSTVLKAGFVVVAFLVTGRFVISALGMVLLVFMTDFVKISLATDRVRPSQAPETWNIGPLARIAVVIGAMMLIEALALLAWGWHRFGLASAPGQLQTFAFETLLFFSVFSILSIRERRAFWRSRPSALMLVALGADAIVGVTIGVLGFAEMRPLPPAWIALIFACAGVLSLGPNDLLKVFLIGRMPTRK